MDQPHRDRLSNESKTAAAPSDRPVVLTMLPLALAIFVFGAIYGVLARPLAGPWLTMLSSAIIFSGACQFSIAGLGAAASPLSVIALALTLNMRHILLGAVLRPRKSSIAFRPRSLPDWPWLRWCSRAAWNSRSTVQLSERSPRRRPAHFSGLSWAERSAMPSLP